jgi:hypothetical protein
MIEEIADREVTPTAFISYAHQQTPNTGLIVRVESDAVALTPAIRTAIRASDPALPVFAASSMEEVRRQGFWQFQLFGQMFGTFGGKLRAGGGADAAGGGRRGGLAARRATAVDPMTALRSE